MPDFSPLHCTPLHRFNLSEGTSAAGTEQVTNVATKHMGRYYLRYAAHSSFFLSFFSIVDVDCPRTIYMHTVYDRALTRNYPQLNFNLVVD